MAVTVHKALAGYYWSDAGALMGVLPYAIWSTKIQFDERRRFQMALNLLVIKHHERIILVDTGLGNKITDRLRKIYNPSEFLLPTSLAELGIRDNDVTDVIMTHLHFDHAGGIVTGFADQDRLTFPKARYWIQAAEWQIAKHPEGLNRAAYNFKDQLSLLEAEGNIELLDGDREIYPGLNLRLVGGHTFGSQIVELD
ncbi:MAG: MBL fold metallo-hydrolase, partial [Candidatus Cloacimonetes bacterium]|nr:MBL fold metallo-hydrolase [Candidatus Cloacimonadota bacterium]